EPFGIVLLEAMSQGTAIVATAAGGATEIVVHEETGLLAPPRDPAAMARAIESLLTDPDRLRAYGAAGRRRVRSAFTLEQQAAQTLTSWELAAAKSGARFPTPARS